MPNLAVLEVDLNEFSFDKLLVRFAHVRDNELHNVAVLQLDTMLIDEALAKLDVLLIEKGGKPIVKLHTRKTKIGAGIYPAPIAVCANTHSIACSKASSTVSASKFGATFCIEGQLEHSHTTSFFSWGEPITT
jgi:hypothetical protein